MRLVADSAATCDRSTVLRRLREDDFLDCIECSKSAEKNLEDVSAAERAVLVRVLNLFERP